MRLDLGPSIMLINIAGVSLVLCGMAGLVLCARAEFDTSVPAGLQLVPCPATVCLKQFIYFY